MGNIATLPLKIMVMLQYVRENCVRILEEEKHRQLRMFVRTSENIGAVTESVRETPSTSVHCRSQLN